ncbi:MAG: elongation factor P maturation arginine rhamnosyltransferase EarP, partial [Burkholderiaceae bacterium]
MSAAGGPGAPRISGAGGPGGPGGPDSIGEATGAAWRVDLFCRVIDNLGDAAVCWRLARQLSEEHGCTVRLWIDQPEVLARLVPGARAARRMQGVRIEAWRPQTAALAQARNKDVADVVIAGFGCDLPAGYRSAMRHTRSVWINLEYFSAEAWTLGSHGLPSPKSDGLTEHFFIPGPGPATGGLLR